MGNTKIQLELEEEELLILREALKELGTDTGLRSWMANLKQQVLNTLCQAYEKPEMKREEYIQRLQKESAHWKSEGGYLQSQMVSGLAQRLEFLYSIEGCFSYFNYEDKLEIFPELKDSSSVLDAVKSQIEMNPEAAYDEWELGD